jgi:hypothetical protein
VVGCEAGRESGIGMAGRTGGEGTGRADAPFFGSDVWNSKLGTRNPKLLVQLPNPTLGTGTRNRQPRPPPPPLAEPARLQRRSGITTLMRKNRGESHAPKLRQATQGASLAKSAADGAPRESPIHVRIMRNPCYSVPMNGRTSLRSSCHSSPVSYARSLAPLP